LRYLREEQRERGDEQSIDSEERGFCFHGVGRQELAVVSWQLAGSGSWKKVGSGQLAVGSKKQHDLCRKLRKGKDCCLRAVVRAKNTSGCGA
jgi:hypothetical protein